MLDGRDRGWRSGLAEAGKVCDLPMLRRRLRRGLVCRWGFRAVPVSRVRRRWRRLKNGERGLAQLGDAKQPTWLTSSKHAPSLLSISLLNSSNASSTLSPSAPATRSPISSLSSATSSLQLATAPSLTSPFLHSATLLAGPTSSTLARARRKSWPADEEEDDADEGLLLRPGPV